MPRIWKVMPLKGHLTYIISRLSYKCSQAAYVFLCWFISLALFGMRSPLHLHTENLPNVLPSPLRFYWPRLAYHLRLPVFSLSRSRRTSMSLQTLIFSSLACIIFACSISSTRSKVYWLFWKVCPITGLGLIIMTPRGSWVADPQSNSLGQSLGMPVDQWLAWESWGW